MKSIDPGILPRSVCFSFTPSDLAQKLYFYPIWCGHYFCTSNYFMKRDTYPPLLLAYIRKGCFKVEYRNQTYEARKGDVILLDCVEPHYYYAEDGLEFVYLHFDGSNSHEICQQLLSVHGPLIKSSNNMLVGNLLYDYVEFNSRNDVENMFDSSFRIYQLLHLLNTNIKNEHSKEHPVDETIRYIRNNIGKKITLDELAQIANLSPYYFSHYFKAQTGYSPLEYVISTRLDQAKILLIRTNMTIAEIAYEVGYESASSLINLFIQKLGESPKQYRKQQSIGT